MFRLTCVAREVLCFAADLLALSGCTAVITVPLHDRLVVLTTANQLMEGLAHQVVYDGVPMGLAVNHTILPEVLKRAGYRTHAVGKWDVCLIDFVFKLMAMRLGARHGT